MSKKVLILHDTFLYKGGGERLILMMGKVLGADIASGFFSAGSFDLRKEGFSGKMIPVSSEVFTKGLRHIVLKLSFMFKTKFIREYESVIFSGDCIAAVRNCKKSTKKIYYCHTPPRYLYDLHDLYLRKVPVYLRPVFTLACKVFRYLYERDIEKMDIILTNSKNTQKRIRDFLGKDSFIVYPPVDGSKFRYLGQEDYYLSFARLADAKRVDRVVEAFCSMPEKKLIVIYGKNDPQKDTILAVARKYENITCITLENNDELYKYIGNAIATIYIPIDEDFGMSPVESMSAGKPVLGVNDGGIKESVIHKQTGYLISEKAKIEEIQEAVEYLSPKKCLEMRETSENRAKDFGLEEFSKQMQSYT